MRFFSKIPKEWALLTVIATANALDEADGEAGQREDAQHDQSDHHPLLQMETAVVEQSVAARVIMKGGAAVANLSDADGRTLLQRQIEGSTVGAHQRRRHNVRDEHRRHNFERHFFLQRRRWMRQRDSNLG